MGADACAREGCTRPVQARDLCGTHYTVAWRRGDFEGMPRPRRAPGHVCPPEHKHGQTVTCYSKHRCTCDGCYVARSASAIQYGRDRFYGRPRSLVPTRGIHRRIQALHAAGWSFRELDRRLGVQRGTTSRLLDGEAVMPSTRDRVCALFEQLEMQSPPSATARERAAITAATRRATRDGWVRAAAWDDIDEDEAPAVPDEPVDIDEVVVERLASGAHVASATYAERLEAIRLLNGRGLADSAIAAFLGMTNAAVFKARDRADISAAVGTDRERIVA